MPRARSSYDGLQLHLRAAAARFFRSFVDSIRRRGYRSIVAYRDLELDGN